MVFLSIFRFGSRGLGCVVGFYMFFGFVCICFFLFISEGFLFWILIFYRIVCGILGSLKVFFRNSLGVGDVSFLERNKWK